MTRAADRAAELVDGAGYRPPWRSRAGVEVAVAEKLECIAVEPVSAGFGDDVDDRAGALAELGVVVAGLYAEFLQGVRERERAVDVGHLIDVVAAVQKVV